MTRLTILLAISFLVSVPGVQAQANSAQKNSDLFEGLGQEQLGEPGPHWVWVTDLILRHSQPFDAAEVAGFRSAPLRDPVGFRAGLASAASQLPTPANH